MEVVSKEHPRLLDVKNFICPITPATQEDSEDDLEFLDRDEGRILNPETSPLRSPLRSPILFPLELPRVLFLLTRRRIRRVRGNTMRVLRTSSS